MFELEVLHWGGLGGMHGCYLSKLYFSLKQHFFSLLLLFGEVYFSPKVGGAERKALPAYPQFTSGWRSWWSWSWQLHKSLAHGANRWQYKIKHRPPMLQGRSRSIKSYLPCRTVQPSESLNPPLAAQPVLVQGALLATQERPVWHLQCSDSYLALS